MVAVLEVAGRHGVRISFVLAAICTTGCASWRDWRMERSLERSRADAYARIDPEQCRADGGTVRSVGMFGTPACVLPFRDAGQFCADGSECQGLCKADPGATAGKSATGTCQTDSHDIYGCYDTIEQGVVVAGACFD